MVKARAPGRVRRVGERRRRAQTFAFRGVARRAAFPEAPSGGCVRDLVGERRRAPARGARHRQTHLQTERGAGVCGVGGGCARERALLARVGARGGRGEETRRARARVVFPGVARGRQEHGARLDVGAEHARARASRRDARRLRRVARRGVRDEGVRGEPEAVPCPQTRGAAVVPALVLGRVRLGHPGGAGEHPGRERGGGGGGGGTAIERFRRVRRGARVAGDALGGAWRARRAAAGRRRER
mmetsp:Transcript_16100/g.67748  ORF Transcript_16100/g.67748 Transcript_16100/m.67748 type:complete len:243 (+) Transcript_16100:575-1303(+)